MEEQHVPFARMKSAADERVEGGHVLELAWHSESALPPQLTISPTNASRNRAKAASPTTPAIVRTVYQRRAAEDIDPEPARPGPQGTSAEDLCQRRVGRK